MARPTTLYMYLQNVIVIPKWYRTMDILSSEYEDGGAVKHVYSETPVSFSVLSSVLEDVHS